MHPHAPRAVTRARSVIATLALTLVLASCGSNSFFQRSSEAFRSESASPGSIVPTSIAPAGHETAVAEYAAAVLERKVTKAAVPASAAALYLDYLARGETIGANVAFEEVRRTSVGFELKIDDVRYDFGDMSISPAGVEDLALNGVALSQRLASVRDPVILDGLRITSGVSYLTAVGHRIVILTAVNKSGIDLRPVPSLSSFLQIDGTTLPDLGSLAAPAEIPAGGKADVAFISLKGDQQPDGVLTYAFRGDDGRAIDISVPLGKARQSFFQVDEDGTVTGALHSDIGFPNGSDVLSAEAQNILSAAARELANIADADAPICAVGHADSVGTEADNLALSTKRAEAVRDELVRAGVTREIGVIGHGERFAPGDELPDPNSRRVDIRLERCPT